MKYFSNFFLMKYFSKIRKFGRKSRKITGRRVRVRARTWGSVTTWPSPGRCWQRGSWSASPPSSGPSRQDCGGRQYNQVICIQPWRCWGWIPLNRRWWIFRTTLPSTETLRLLYVIQSTHVLRKGLIYFPDFCQLILKRFRNSEEQEENFKQNMFKVWTEFVHVDICK